MEFLQPLALLALAGVPVPALLHLLQRREPPTVVFPAVRYLVDAERRHSRRLRLRNLLLLIMRTLLILTLAFAAARPVVSARFGGAHAPSAVAVVLDNSPSSSAVVGGRPALTRLVAAARDVGARAAPGDRLWLVTADGIPRSVRPAAWRDAIDRVGPGAARLDLGDAVRTAAEVVDGQRLPGAVVVLSDLQESAVSSAASPVPVVVLEPAAPPANRGVADATVEPEVWTPGGEVRIRVGGRSGEGGGSGEVTLEIDGRSVARGLASPGEDALLAVERIEPGWRAARVTLAPDEFRTDDVRFLALRGAPAPAVATAGAGPFVDAAVAVLTQSGRLRRGADLLVGDQPARGRSVVIPPEDPAAIGAVNRSLAARGVPARFGEVQEGEWPLASGLFALDGVAVRRRYRLVGDATVLATAGGEPWIVRHGATVLVASRLEEGWTDLPLQPAFVPFIDALLNRSGSAEAWRVAATPGEQVRLPGSARHVLLPGEPVPVAAGEPLTAPSAPGVYFVAGPAGDTVGALVVNLDPRESDLTPASAPQIATAFGGATVVSAGALADRAFAVRRAELTTPLLIVTLLLAAGELVVATVGAARQSAEA